jgi:hypothetical protein
MMTANDVTWYRDAILYEVFVRAFADSNGDGIGDLPGLISRLDYLQDLGVDTIWLLPIPFTAARSWLRRDRQHHPDYGTLADCRQWLRPTAGLARRRRVGLTRRISIRGFRPRDPGHHTTPRTVTGMCGATPLKRIKTRALSSSTPSRQTGPSIRCAGNTTGIASLITNPI